MNKLLLTLTLLLSFNSLSSAQESEVRALITQDQSAQKAPDRYTKYSLENNDLKILIFKIDYGEPAQNPLHFNAYFQCKNNNKYFRLNRKFNNNEEESPSYCGHNNFYIGSIKSEGNKSYLILPMKTDKNNTCSSDSNSIETFPIDEMIQKCNS